MTVSSTENSSENLEKKPKKLGTIYKWVRGFFYACAAGFAIMMIGCVTVFFTDYTGYNPDLDFKTPDIFLGIGGIIYLVAFLGGIITFSMFTFRAMRNLHIWDNKYAEMSPGWTVGWYFVPLANLWKPYHAMEQIWTGTHHESSGNYVTNGKIGLWWGCWILFYLTSSVGDALAKMDGPWDIVMRRSAIADFITLTIGVLAVVTIVPILKKIKVLQDSKISSQVFG